MVWTDTDRQELGKLSIRALAVIDMQNDFIDGVLGTPEAENIVDKVVEDINKYREMNGHIFYTQDTHFDVAYEASKESFIPKHCITGTEGWELNNRIAEALECEEEEKDQITAIYKHTFGSTDLATKILEYVNNQLDVYMDLGIPTNNINVIIEIEGLCTDICVISNALIIKACLPSATIVVHSDRCAGSTPEDHQKALDILDKNGIYIDLDI